VGERYPAKTSSFAARRSRRYKCDHGFSKFEAVAMLLPQMCSSVEAVRLVESNLDWEEKLRLRIMLGQGWKPVMGMLSGHYDLDMSEGKDRLAAKKLSEQSTLEMRFSKFNSGRQDSSQTGNWENYRNGTVDGAKKVITSNFFNRPSSVGKVRFDYVCTTRPRKGAQFMGEERFEKLLKLVRLDETASINAFDETPAFFGEYLSKGAINEHWLGWQMTTFKQFEIDRAWGERRRLDEIAKAKEMKLLKAAGKKGKKGKKDKLDKLAMKLEAEKKEQDELEPVPEGAFFLVFGEKTQDERRQL
jgi:hypothetical protein